MRTNGLHSLLYILLLLLCGSLTACQEEIPLPQTDIPMEMMPFRLQTNLNIPSAETRASIVAGNEQAITAPSDITLLCFDVNGLYLGKYSPSVLTPDDADGMKGSLVGQVPMSTCRIHFIAKHEVDVADVPLGTHENRLMLDEHMVVSYKQDLCYWGYKSTQSTDEMKTWLNGDNTVYMIRDRARVHLEAVEKDETTKTIKKVEWIASHGLSKGYIAPFNRANLDTNPFEGYIQVSDGTVKDVSTFTPYEDAKRYIALNQGEVSSLDYETGWGEEDMITAYEWNETNKTATYPANSNLYLFEDPNELPITDGDGRMPVKLIMKVTYMNGKVRYHAVLVMDQDTYEQYHITRNYTYRIRIDKLQEELGKETFKEAVNTTTYSNNQLLDVDKVVTDVSNGTYILRIKGTNGTSTFFTERGTDGNVSLLFEYKEMKNGVEIPVDVDQSAFSVRWLEIYNDLVTSPDPSHVTITYNRETGEGSLTFPISEVTTHLRSGQLLLTDKTAGLARYIYVYAIRYFELPTVTFEKTTYKNNGHNVYKLTFKIPTEYPLGLYPVNFQFATRYLNAFATHYENGVFSTTGAFSVNVSSTDPNRPENKGLTSSTTATDWNYNASQWNYWYTYSLRTDEADETITIYLEDVTGSFSSVSSNNITTMGVFYRIKHFSKMDNGELMNVLSATCGR